MTHEKQTDRRFWKTRRCVAFLIVLIVAVMIYSHFRLKFRRPMGTGPAGPAIAAEPFEAVWSQHRVLLLAMGDSVTAGFGVEAPYNYVRRLVDNPPNELSDMQGKSLRKVLPNMEILNYAMSGSTSLQHEVHIQDRLEMQPSDVFGIVVMTTGGNDIIHNYGQSPPKEGAMYGATLQQAEPWINHFRDRLDRMVLAINDKFPGGCAIFLADIYDPSDGVGDAPSVFLPHWPDAMPILDAYNQVIRECAQKHENVVHVPMHEVFLGHGIHCSEFYRRHYHWGDPTYWFHDNLEDPNIRGYDAIRRVFLQKIVENRDRFPK